MSNRNGGPFGRWVPFGVVVVVLLGVAAWLRPVTAQDGTPVASPEGSPVFELVDCAEPLGLAAGSACVTVVHAAVGAGEVDVYVDGQALLSAFAPGAVSGYVAVPPGGRRLQITAAGAAVEEAAVDRTLTVEAGIAYEVAAVETGGAVTLAVNIADLEPLLDDAARIRVFQAIEGAPPADVVLPDGASVLQNVTAGTASGYAEVPAGSTPLDLEVRPQGLPVSFPIAGATLEPGLVYTFYAIGQVSDPASLRVVPVIAPSSDSAAAGTPGAVASPQAIPLVPGTPMGSPTSMMPSGSPVAATPVA